MSDSWLRWIDEQKAQPYLAETLAHVSKQRREGEVVYPPESEMFNAFLDTPFEKVKVVILGQDPYHGPNQAHGLSFSVTQGNKIPPSLRNIFKELEQDVSEFDIPNHGCLSSWATQGVLLLNTVLSVKQGQANSHKHLNWQQFTDKAISKINDELTGVIFLLWGTPAQTKRKLIDETRHFVLTAPHPSPLSAHRGFFGCGHFSKVNELLLRQNKSPINWNLTEPSLPKQIPIF